MDVKDYALINDLHRISPISICAEPPSVLFENLPVSPTTLMVHEDCERIVDNDMYDSLMKSRRISWKEWHTCVRQLLEKCHRLQQNVPRYRLTFHFDHVVMDFLESVVEFFALLNEAVASMVTVRKYLYNVYHAWRVSERKSEEVWPCPDLKSFQTGLTELERKNGKWGRVLILRLVYKIRPLRTFYWMRLLKEQKAEKWNVKCAVVKKVLPKLNEAFHKLLRFRTLIGGLDAEQILQESRENIHEDAVRDLAILKMERKFQIVLLVINDWVPQKVDELYDCFYEIEELYPKIDTGEPLDFYLDCENAHEIRLWNLDWFERDADILERVLSRLRQEGRMNLND